MKKLATALIGASALVVATPAQAFSWSFSLSAGKYSCASAGTISWSGILAFFSPTCRP